MKYRSLGIVAAALFAAGCAHTTSPIPAAENTTPTTENQGMPFALPNMDNLTPFINSSLTANTPLNAAYVSRNTLLSAMKNSALSATQKAELQVSLNKLNIEIQKLEQKAK